MSVPIPENPLEDLLRTLKLERLTTAANGEDLFEGPSQWMPHGRVYGGQVLAQSLVAASQTIDTEGIRNVHSLHGYFLRPGDIELPITFSVDRLRDGRSFSTRRVQAFQNNQPIFSMIASFQDTDPGLDHQDAFPENIPDPESLPTAASLLGDSEHPVVLYWAKARPFDMRHVTSPIFFKVDGEHVAHDLVDLALRLGADRAVIVSDASAALLANPGQKVQMGGTEIVVSEQGVARREDGTLASSGMSQLEAIEARVRGGLSRELLLRSATIIPANLLGESKLGRLAAGATADIVHYQVDTVPMVDMVLISGEKCPL
jgi:hypothetical protein